MRVSRGARRTVIIAGYCAAAVLGGVMLLSGCGGTTRLDRANARSVVQSYEAALVGGDGAQACSLLTADSRREIAGLSASLPAGRHGTKPAGCADYVGFLAYAIARRPKALARVKGAKVGAARITGNRATVMVEEPGEEAREITLLKTHTGWAIAFPRPATATYFSLRVAPAAISPEPPQAVVQQGREVVERFNLGRTVVAQSGCLACHRIGDVGNDGPGPFLTHIGSTRTPASIERAIIKPTAPMPSFRRLPRTKLRAVVTFLSSLR
jgi:hypothetical protein